MKNILVIVLLYFLVLLSGCRQNDAPAALKFTASKHNPILSPGEPGSWDELYTCVPNIIYQDSMFYLFYMGRNASGRIAIGLATSQDGAHFEKFGGNPIISSDNQGFDAFNVGAGIVVKEDSVWAMYFNALETAGFTPGPNIGKAKAKKLSGPWTKYEKPVLVAGSKSEWDAGFVIPSSVIALKEGGFRMYYSGGNDYVPLSDFFIGMATSSDGITWKKYNDPLTKEPPFAQSDPVFIHGDKGEWDDNYVWMGNVMQFHEGYRMFYTGFPLETKQCKSAIGYATSKDGIHWKRYPKNPLYQSEDEEEIENPSILFLDTNCYLFYDYNPSQGKIGFATARVR